MEKNTVSILEQNLHLSQSELLEQGLKVQNAAYGVLDAPFLDGILRGHPSIKRMLDIGTGDGSFVADVAQRHPGVSMLAIDHNSDLIEKADVHKASLGLNNIEFRTAFFDNAFEPDRYDLIFTRFTLEHSSDPLGFLREVFKRLECGGCLVVVEEYWLDMLIEDEVWRTFREFMLASYRTFGGNPFVPRDLAGWLKHAGFSDIESSLAMCSPATIGAQKFRRLVLTIPTLIHKFKTGIWDEAFFPVLEAWIDEVIATGRIDPCITIAHAIAWKA